MPVSRTSKRTHTVSSSWRVTRPLSTTLPCSVNFTALLMKFTSTCPSRTPSPCRTGGTPLSRTTSSRPLASTLSATRAVTLLTICSSSKSVGSSVILPASILEKSRMSLMIASRCMAAPDTLSSCCNCLVLSGSRRIRCVRPMMAFIGVRISWLMLARNELLARLALSATSLAWRSASAAWCSSVMSSIRTSIVPTSASSRVACIRAQNTVPSRRTNCASVW